MRRLVGAVGGLLLTLGCAAEPGPMGPMGLQGEPGQDGAVGAQGPQGLQGEQGEPGAAAPEGQLALDVASRGADVANIVGGIAEHAQAFVIVQCTSDGESFSFGSGTKTERGSVLTADHVVEGTTDCDIFSESPVQHLGSVLEFHQQGERDQMELTIDWTEQGESIQGVEPTLDTLPEVGDFIVVVGHPGVGSNLALEHQYTTGYVTAAAPTETLNNLARGTYWSQGYTTDAVAWHGNSGGPVFNQDGEWIGLLVGSFNGAADNTGPDLTVAIPLL